MAAPLAGLAATGLLDMNIPADFSVPDPSRVVADEDPLDEDDLASPEFHKDFLE